MGVHAQMDEFGYVYGEIPASAGCEERPAIGLIALAILAARRSELFRSLPRKSLLTGGERMGTLLTAPVFWIGGLIMIALTVVDAVA